VLAVFIQVPLCQAEVNQVQFARVFEANQGVLQFNIVVHEPKIMQNSNALYQLNGYFQARRSAEASRRALRKQSSEVLSERLLMMIADDLHPSLALLIRQTSWSKVV
jgi:hypothetical protein